MFSLAQEIIFDRYKNPQYTGEVINPDFQAQGANPVCGDEISIQGMFDESDRFSEIKHTGRSCAICTASADLLIEKILGENLEYLKNISTEDIQEMINIPLSPVRLKCALLPLETLKQAQI